MTKIRFSHRIHTDVIKPVLAHYLGMDLDAARRLAVANASASLVGFGEAPPRVRYINYAPWQWRGARRGRGRERAVITKRSVKVHFALGRSYLAYLFKLTKPPLPCLFNIDPSSACNLRCVFCPQSDPPDTMTFGLMDFALFERIVAEIERSTVCAGLSLFLAGEPLLNKNLSRMVALARDRLGTPPQIATNGVLLTREVARSLIDAGAGSFLIDFCADAAHYESMCPPAAWERVRENIQGLGDTVLSSGADVAVRLKNLDWRGSTDEERGRSLRALQDLFGTERPYSYLEYKLHNWAGDFSATAKERYGYRRNSRGKKLTYHPCSHLWFMMNIHYDGSVSICCRDAMKGAIVGDLARRSLREIWNGPEMVRMRELMVQRRHDLIPICRNCDRVWTGGYSGGSPFRLAVLFVRMKMGAAGLRRRGRRAADPAKR